MHISVFPSVWPGRFGHLFRPRWRDAEIAAIQAMADKYGIDIKIAKKE
jgi:hypothetical protein